MFDARPPRLGSSASDDKPQRGDLEHRDGLVLIRDKFDGVL